MTGLASVLFSAVLEAERVFGVKGYWETTLCSISFLYYSTSSLISASLSCSLKGEIGSGWLLKSSPANLL